MGIIQTLPTNVVHLIAAGEVLDSLAAVVQELIENAIDAQANRISISLWTDTLSVQVSDNGQGMALADLQQAASPHTTSKIQSETDLHRVSSLGFRGEALHSLAQLSDLQICSRQGHDGLGWQVSYDCKGNVIGEPKTVAIAPGTVVTAKYIFGNRPSRLQALPAVPQQLRQVQLQIQQTAIAHPHITWQVNLNDRQWFSLWAGTNMRDLIVQVVNSLTVGDLTSGKFDELEINLSPSQAISPIDRSRSTLGNTSDLDLPQENLQSDLTSQHLKPANLKSLVSDDLYRSGGHLSYCPIQISVTLGLPDRASRRRPDWVKVAINGRFVKFPEMEQIILGKFNRTLPRHRYPICIAHLQVPPQHVDWNRQPSKTEVYLHHLEQYQKQLGDLITELLQIPDPQKLHTSQTATRLLRMAEDSLGYSTSPVQNNAPKALAQVHNTYILAEHATGLWLVEQHIAHERVLFEQLESQYEIVAIEEPIILSRISLESVEQLQSLGLEIESFGEELWAVRSLPAMLLNCEDAQAALLELSLQADPQLTRATIACRAALRNGTPLELPAMQDLLNQWQKTRNPHTCPHGRPICLSLEETHLARFFKRNWLVDKK